MTNRERGDYLERQAKSALVDLGWVVVRAAGSHGVADLVALRAGNTPLLVSCKLNGYLRPAERHDLLAAAERAGARPILAGRLRRGWVRLYVVREGALEELDEVQVPRSDARTSGV